MQLISKKWAVHRSPKHQTGKIMKKQCASPAIFHVFSWKSALCFLYLELFATGLYLSLEKGLKCTESLQCGWSELNECVEWKPCNMFPAAISWPRLKRVYTTNSQGAHSITGLNMCVWMSKSLRWKTTMWEKGAQSQCLYSDIWCKELSSLA